MTGLMSNFYNCLKLNASLRYIFIGQIFFSLFTVIVISERYQQLYQSFDQSEKIMQKDFQHQQLSSQQQFSSYLSKDFEELNPKSGHNRGTKFISIPISNFNDIPGALVTVELQQYHNPDLALPGGFTCACPSGLQCPYLQDHSITCFFSFTIITSATNQSVQLIESPFVQVSKSPINSGIWTEKNILNTTVKPNAIDIIVHHLGVVINQATGNLEYFNQLTLIDIFVIPLSNYHATPHGTSPNIKQATISGQILGTTLQVAYYVECIDGKLGSNCDLKCKQVSPNSLHAVCMSIITGMHFSCKYAMDLIKIFDCKQCPYGLTKDQTECNAPITDLAISQNLISPTYRIWTVVLGTLLGIAIIFIIILVIIFTITQKRDKSLGTSRRQIGTTSSTTPRTHPGKTLLSREHDEWQRSKIRATARDSGVSTRTATATATSEERIEDEYFRSNVLSVGRREAHV
uniref:Uncharacterized protein n=1 Tax=Setaria digitata TaxID=48799 RepID=A0A915Q1Q0_9BILA